MAFNFPFDLSGTKDKTVSKLALQAARSYLKEFGEVIDLVLDSKARTIAVEALPVGEREPIRLTVEGYDLVADDAGAGWLSFERLTASREWITRVAEAALPGKRLRLPPNAPIGLLKSLL